MAKEKLYWLIVLITLIYLIWKYRRNAISIIIILSFYSGLAAFHGKMVENQYKVLLLFLTLLLLIRYNTLIQLRSKEKILLFTFVIFSFSFFLSSFLNHDSLLMLFSQYTKYLISVGSFLILIFFIKKNPDDISYYKQVFFSVLNIQIILSFCKWALIGVQEWVVGSISYNGGGVATPLPVLGFMLLWLNNKGEMKAKDWLFVMLLLVISFVSMKRAIWFIMPAFVVLFLYYVPKNTNLTKLIYYIPLIPLIFYFGVKLNPTLNREGKIGGSFDLQYVADYVLEYSFGKTDESKSNQIVKGRGGATILIWERILNPNSLSFHDFFGYGLTKMYSSDYETFDTYDFGINSKGSATGIFQSYVTSGYIGILLTILFIISILRLINNFRIRITVGIFLFYDYLFYSGLILRTPALMIFLFLIIIVSNSGAIQNNEADQVTYKTVEK